MPVYKVNGKKDGLQKYNVRVNYTDSSGISRQLTRTAYGLEAAKDLERKLAQEQKEAATSPAKKMTVGQLSAEYLDVKKHELRKASLAQITAHIELYILPALDAVRIDRLSGKTLQDWKLWIEQITLSNMRMVIYVQC